MKAAVESSESPDDGPLAWSGSRLPDGVIGIVTATSPETTIVAATKSEHAVRLPPHQLSSFLSLHAERTFVCRDVPALLGLLCDHSGESNAGFSVLLQAAREYRCVDRTLELQRELSVDDSYFAPPPKWPDAESPSLAAESAMTMAMTTSTSPTYGVYLSRHYPRTFGRYGVGIDVQAAIVLEDAGEMQLEDGALCRLDDALRTKIARLTDVLRKHAGRCFHANGRHFKWHKTHLQKWLDDRFSDLRDRLGRPFCPPRVWISPGKRGISTWPSDWGHLALCHPFLHAWRDLAESATLASFLRQQVQNCSNGRLRFRPTYELVPTTRIRNPNLAFLHEVLPGAIQPPPGRRWVIGRLTDLELRCFIAVCEKHGSDDHPRRGLLTQLVCQRPSQNDLAVEDSVLPALTTALAREHAKNAQSSRSVNLRMTQVLAFGLTRWLASEHIRVLLNEALAVEMTAQEVNQLEQSFLSCAPEIENIYEDIVQPAYPRLRDDEVSPYANSMIIKQAQCLPGRLGMSGIGTQAQVHEFLELADSIMKHVVFELGVHSHRVVAFCGDEFIIEVPRASPHIERDISKVATDAAERLAEGVAFACHCRVGDMW